ncbi:hypothetical gene supported by AF152002 [Rattus norvegicus]|uniref:Hypothetical gene supported by AF152002 n=1 Tax=Rattus norvegicus TaxID=10116 RepID=A6K9J1_RAT|nr:hypothetical gene supported by AF152002 [Rattus norvegicus]
MQKARIQFMGGAWGSPTDIGPPEAGLHRDETLMSSYGDNLLAPTNLHGQKAVTPECFTSDSWKDYRIPSPRSKGATNLQSHYDPGSAHKSSWLLQSKSPRFHPWELQIQRLPS